MKMEIKERLLKLDTACICDANKKLRVMDPEIKPISQGIKFVGIAHTVQCESDFLTVIKALNDAKEGEILVINAEGEKIAVVGELFSTEAKRKKLAGIIIDGGCRDIKQLRKINFPVYARFIAPKSGTNYKIFSTQVKITCGGVPVFPGDIIFGDDDGIVVMNEEEIIEIIDIAEDIQHKEELVLTKIENNESLIDMLNFSEHYLKISNHKKSELTFTLDKQC